MIELRTVGALELLDAAGHPIRSVTARPKRVGLLIYLALARPHGAHRRATLLGLFWGESSEGRGRRALNQAIYVLRQGLGTDTIQTHGDGVELDFAAVRCDAADVEARLAAGDAGALELYTGDLLPGFHLDGCPAFERWLEEERARLRALAAASAAAEAGRLLAAGNPAGAAHCLRRAVARRPLDEALTLRLAGSLAAGHDVAPAPSGHGGSPCLRFRSGHAAALGEWPERRRQRPGRSSVGARPTSLAPPGSAGVGGPGAGRGGAGVTGRRGCGRGG